MNPTLLASKQQIIFAYEELHLSAFEIASQFEDYGFSEEDIRTLLADHSSKYRDELSNREQSIKEGSATLSELDALMQEYRHLSKCTDNDLVKERALKFLINEQKGRNDLAARGIALKERQIGVQEVDVARKAAEFSSAIKQISARLQDVLSIGPSKPQQVLELSK